MINKKFSHLIQLIESISPIIPIESLSEGIDAQLHNPLTSQPGHLGGQDLIPCTKTKIEHQDNELIDLIGCPLLPRSRCLPLKTATYAYFHQHLNFKTECDFLAMTPDQTSKNECNT